MKINEIIVEDHNNLDENFLKSIGSSIGSGIGSIGSAIKTAATTPVSKIAGAAMKPVKAAGRAVGRGVKGLDSVARAVALPGAHDTLSQDAGWWEIAKHGIRAGMTGRDPTIVPGAAKPGAAKPGAAKPGIRSPEAWKDVKPEELKVLESRRRSSRKA